MTEVLMDLTYSLAGFVVGYLFGRITKESIMRRTLNELHGNVGVTGRTLGVVVVVMSCLTVASAAVNGYQVSQQQNCVRDYNRQFAKAFKVRAEVADADRAALNGMLLAIGDTRLNAAERRERYVAYLDQIKAGDAARKKTPLPAPPDPNTMCE